MSQDAKAGPGGAPQTSSPRALDLAAQGWRRHSGIGEKFAANPVTGTGSMSVPIAISPDVPASARSFR